MTTHIQVTDTGLEIIPPRDTLTQGSDNTLTIEFEFSGAWLECTEINAVFTDDINSATTQVTGDACVVPVEVLQNPWRFVSISLTGISAGGVITSPFVRIGQVLPSASGGEGGKFVTMAQLMEILRGYAKAEDLDVYVTDEELQEAIKNFATLDDINRLSADIEQKADKTQLADYWGKAEIALQTDGDGKKYLANDGEYYEMQGGGEDKVFIAEYNVTTAQEIIAFIDATNEPYAPMQVKRAGSYYTVVTAAKQDTDKVIIRTFGTLSGSYYMFTYTITGNVWASASYGFQPTLISGNNIKTINGESLLGSGDIPIQGGGDVTRAELDAVHDELQAEIEAQAADIAGKVAQADFDALSETVTAQGVGIDAKANAADLTAAQADIDANTVSIAAQDARISANEANIIALQNDKADKTQLSDYETSEHAAATFAHKNDIADMLTKTEADGLFADKASLFTLENTAEAQAARISTAETNIAALQTDIAGKASDADLQALSSRVGVNETNIAALQTDKADASALADYETTAHASETYLKIADAASTYATQTAISDMATQTWVQQYIASLDGTNMKF